MKCVGLALVLLLAGCVDLERRLVGEWGGGTPVARPGGVFGLVLGPDMSLRLNNDLTFTLAGGEPRHEIEGSWRVFDGKVWLEPGGHDHFYMILLPSEDLDLLRDEPGEIVLTRVQPDPALVTEPEAPAPAEGADAVLIDHGEPSYTVYMKVPAEFVAEVQAKASGDATVQLVGWTDFTEELLTSRIVHDAYPGSRAVEGVVALLDRYPGTPVGLTWNGGIAITRNDYQFAKLSHASYRAQPEDYAPPPPRADPVRPGAHLGPLLGW